MSKIGKKPIIIPEGVSATITGGAIEVKGKNGSLTVALLPQIAPEIKDGILTFSTTSASKQARANFGTMRALTANAVTGVTEGFLKILEIEGVGFRAMMEGDTLVLNIGFSHPVKFPTPEGVKIAVEKNAIKISGADKNMVGKVAATIRKFKKPEPYKGKGIRYQGEVIRRKEGKKAAGATK